MTATQDDFDFFTIGTGDRDFGGYFSDCDTTEISPNLLVLGSKNVYKKNQGNLSVRPGLKRYLAQDNTLNGTKSSYEWSTSFAADRPVRVLADGQFQVLFNEEWITLATYDTTRFAFTTWWNDNSQQEMLVFVRGTTSEYAWTGGMVEETGAANSAGVLVTGWTGLESMTLSATVNNSEAIYTGNNNQVSADAHSVVILDGQPDDGDTIAYNVSNTGAFHDVASTIVFKSSLTGVIAAGTTGYVLIGATKEATAANLLAFFQSPGTDTATQVGITDSDTITGYGYEGYSQANSLETVDGVNWSTLGFTDGTPGTSASLVINGIEYQYYVVAGKFLSGFSTIPPSGDMAFQAIQETQEIISDTYLCDFCGVVNNQVILGSYTSSVVYFSFDENYTRFTQSNDIISGDPDNIVLDERPRGVIVVNESAYIPAGSGNWYICTPNTPLPIAQPIDGSNDRLVIVKVQKKLGAAKTAALAHEFLGAIADTIIYLGQDHQLRMFGVFADILGTKFPSVSLPIKQELIDTDFTGGQLRAIGDNIYLVAPVPGKTYIYQQRDDVNESGNIVSERIWQPPFEWNISRIAVINDTEYGYSNQSPETYQLWNTEQYHDDTPNGVMPYECVVRFGYWQFKDRTKIGDLDKVWIEGYMPENTQLTSTLRADYLGATAIEDVVVSAMGDSPVLYTQDGILVGQKIVGQSLIGGATQVSGLPKFRAIAQYKKYQCFEYQIELSSTAIDSQWELLSLGSNGSQVINKPVQLLKG